MAAVVFDSADPLSQVAFESPDAKLEITSLPVGVNVYLFQAPAGSYCLTSFQFGRWHFFAKDKQQQLGCFEVKAGQLGYSGTLAPRVIDGQPVINQNIDLASFRMLMNSRYPIIAKQFLPPEVKAYTASDLATPASTTDVPINATASIATNIKPQHAPASGTDQISDWIEEIPATRAQVVFFRNNTAWPMEVRKFELYDCIAIKQTCGVQKLKLLLQPHTTKQAMIVEPDNDQDAYSFRFRFIYGFVQHQSKH
ncbi:MAG TPA: hypothetical protein VLV87_00775 [Gammaproteobacteria bacterium]|nr:hypothetical protein [Gammaproteobacteria bacterium]